LHTQANYWQPGSPASASSAAPLIAACAVCRLWLGTPAIPPINGLAWQIENEYGYYGHDKDYLKHLVGLARQHLGQQVSTCVAAVRGNNECCGGGPSSGTACCSCTATGVIMSGVVLSVLQLMMAGCGGQQSVTHQQGRGQISQAGDGLFEHPGGCSMAA